MQSLGTKLQRTCTFGILLLLTSQPLKYAEEACYVGAVVVKALSSGLEIGSSNWTIEDPKGKDFIFIKLSIIAVCSFAMEFDYRALQGDDLVLNADFSFENVIEDVE
ncbi:hypothetical protein M5689_019603 [Euphorbia peplus]|nr:hypothetical protein M5689_019603 [Euphorbia peplus]